MARCSSVWPRMRSALRTLASVFQSSVFISLLRSWSILVARMASNRARTLSFFFTLFRPLKFTGEKIIHHQSSDKGGDAKILLWIVVMDIEPKMIATLDQPGEKFVDPVLLLVSPLTNRIQEPSSSQTQIRTRLDAGGRGEELPQIGVIEPGISILIELSFPRVISLELEVQTVVRRDAIGRRMQRRLPHQRPHQFINVFEFLQRFPAGITIPPIEPRREPDRERLREIFVRMTLRVPIVQVHDVTATEWPWPIKVRRFFVRSLSKNLRPSFIAGKMVGVVVSVRRLVPD